MAHVLQIRAVFKFTDKSLEALRKENLPEHVLKKLDALKNKDVGQEMFESAVSECKSIDEKKAVLKAILNRAHLLKDKDNLPNKARAIDQVPPALWQLFRELCEGQHKWPLYVYGPPGAGKSCAALCLVDRVQGAKFWHMPALDEQIRDIKAGTAEYYNTGSGGKWTMKNWWVSFAKLPLVVLDDVGIPEVSSDTQSETLFMALEAREGRPLICTSNINSADIETAYNSRVHSRMCSGTIHNLMGRDRRFDPPAAPAANTPQPVRK